VRAENPLVKIPASLRQYASHQASLELPGRGVAEVIAALANLHPQLQQQLFNQPEQLHSYLNIFVVKQNIRDLAGLNSAIGAEQSLLILAALSGG
jgi:sulfur-carrier protein